MVKRRTGFLVPAFIIISESNMQHDISKLMKRGEALKDVRKLAGQSVKKEG